MVLLSSFLVRRPLYLELGSSHPVLWASYLVPRPLHRMPELSCGIQKYSAQCVGPHTWYAGSLIWFQDPIILISETMSLLSNAGLSFVVSCVESSHVGLGHLCLVPGPSWRLICIVSGPFHSAPGPLSRTEAYPLSIYIRSPAGAQNPLALYHYHSFNA